MDGVKKKETKVAFKLVRIADTRESGENRILIKLTVLHFNYTKSHITINFQNLLTKHAVSYFIGNFRDNYFRLHYLEETLSLP